ncbi:cell division protein FtsQ/DivIB [Sciscionella marina]|uniref:cell division protein FtsQ/DivIB n=1 Tax=Sciscionella marina TaxID=508770 RepID=UPI00037818F0|nr:FtsQ-type POTRA domain-containing protein [Sciscionella marina]
MTATSARRAPSRRPDGPTRGRIRTRRLVALGIVLLVLAILIVLFFTPLFTVGSVAVSGNSRVSADLVRRTANVEPGSSMFGADTGAIADRVTGLAPVKTAEVSRSWPSTIDIRITERSPAAWTRGADGSVQLIDANGVPFASAPKPPGGEMELRVGPVQPGDLKVRAALGVAGRITPQLRAKTAAVTANSPDDVELVLRDGKTVKWGGNVDNDRKNKVLAALLTRKGKIYDVATPDMPTVSGG